MAQERRVLLANGQYITIVQTTGSSSGDVMSQSAVTAALSAKSDVGHKHAAADITSGQLGTAMIADGAVTAIKVADGAITMAKLGSDVPISTTSYEVVTVSGLTANGGAAVGAEVTIGGFTCKFDSTGVISAQVPYGQIYKIQAHQNSAWFGGYEATFTASTSLRTISIAYVEPNGVFIEEIDGTLYTSSNWVSNKTPNSIVVAGNGISFRIGLTEQSMMPIIFNYTDPLEMYLVQMMNTTLAMADYNGAENTANIMKLQPSTSYAAGYCDSFIFPDGKTKGFLPSLGQLNLAYQNKEAVDAALNKCGGTAMITNARYWSSTFWGIDNVQGDEARTCWHFTWSNGNIYYDYANNYGYARPFATYC